MKPRVNYRAERAERTRKKAAKKEARLAAKHGPAKDTPETEAGHTTQSADETPQGREGDKRH